MNILILTGKFGMGHYSVAAILLEQLANGIENSNVVVEDIFDHVLKRRSNIIYKSYSQLVKHGDYIFNIAYRRRDNRENHFHLTKRFLNALGNIVESRQTDVIISTLPLCSLLASDYKETTGKQILLITCITDFFCHSDWLYPHTDIYMTASEFSKKCLIDRGVSERRIFVSGIPVRKQFQPDEQKQSNFDRRRLLIMGGGFGLLPKSELFYKELNELQNIKATVITGRNRLLYNSLHNALSNIEVLGYVDDVYKYMQQADLILSKPGGITLFEAIYTELPILMFWPSLEQEVRNGAFITENKLGVMLSKSYQLSIAEIETILQNSELHNSIRENMRKFKSTLDNNALLRLLNCYKHNLNSV